jgi:hypothetical protein
MMIIQHVVARFPLLGGGEMGERVRAFDWSKTRSERSKRGHPRSGR